MQAQSHFKLLWARMLQQSSGQVPISSDPEDGGILQRVQVSTGNLDSSGEYVIENMELAHRVEIEDLPSEVIVRLKLTDGSTVPLVKFDDGWYFSSDKQPFPVLFPLTISAALAAEPEITVFGFASRGGKIFEKISTSTGTIKYNCGPTLLELTNTDERWSIRANAPVPVTKKTSLMNTPGPLADLVPLETNDAGYMSFDSSAIVSSVKAIISNIPSPDPRPRLQQLVSSMSPKWKEFAVGADHMLTEVYTNYGINDETRLVEGHVYGILTQLKALYS